MKKLSALMLLMTICSSLAFGQDTLSSSTTNLIGTTWKIYYDYCGKNATRWSDYGTITFLQNGKIKGDSNGRWKLVGNKLTVEGVTNTIVEMNTIVRGNKMTGTAWLGMTNVTEFCVRVVRQN